MLVVLAELLRSVLFLRGAGGGCVVGSEVTGSFFGCGEVGCEATGVLAPLEVGAGDGGESVGFVV